jgi:hypothetical protein
LRCGTVRAFCYKKEEEVHMEDLFEQMLLERIDVLLSECFHGNIQEEEAFDTKMEEFMMSLDKKQKEELERILDDWISKSAESNRYLYLSGLKDGIRIFKMISGI